MLDANILIRAVLGSRVLFLLRMYAGHLEFLRPVVDGHPVSAIDRDAFFAPLTNAALMAAAGMGGGTAWVQPARGEREALALEAVRLAVELGVNVNASSADGRTARPVRAAGAPLTGARRVGRPRKAAPAKVSCTPGNVICPQRGTPSSSGAHWTRGISSPAKSNRHSSQRPASPECDGATQEELSCGLHRRE